MNKWTIVKVKQEIVDQIDKEVDKSTYKNLSDFVTKAIQLRLQTLGERPKATQLRPPKIVGLRARKCTNGFVHNIKVVKYEDGSMWVTCPMFGWFEDSNTEETLKLGCKEREKRCTWFVG